MTGELLIQPLEVVIDPKWETGIVILDNKPHILLSVHHPRFGKISFMTPVESAEQLQIMLNDSVLSLSSYSRLEGEIY